MSAELLGKDRHILLGINNGNIVSGYAIIVEINNKGYESKIKRYKEIVGILLIEHKENIKLLMNTAGIKEVEYLRDLAYKANEILKQISRSGLDIRQSDFFISKLCVTDADKVTTVVNITDTIIKS